MRVISIGDLVTDYYYKNGKLLGVNGGMTAHNIIANLASHNVPTAVFGTCGNDQNGRVSIKSLKELKVDVDNIDVIEHVKTRCFHVTYQEENGKLTFFSKKRCPFCNHKEWYQESMIDTKKILSLIKEDDILVFDNLNVKNRKIIDLTHNIKMLDLGQYFELENLSDEEIKQCIKNKFKIINLNERVEKYLLERYHLSSLVDIYQLFHPDLILVTRGKKGADFVYDQKLIIKILENPSSEIDPTGAGDAFFASFIETYMKRGKIDKQYIDDAFEKATKLTKQVVKKMGARGHLNHLYKIKKEKNSCTCDTYTISDRKQMKRCNININHLETRMKNALNSNAFMQLNRIEFENIKTALFVGSGGSLAAAYFSMKVMNHLFGMNAYTILPRDIKYRNNTLVDCLFLFSYSGTTKDMIEGTNAISNDCKFIITKGQVDIVITKTGVKKENVISYRTQNNKGKEKGFLSFEGAIVPASLFFKKYLLEINKEIDAFDFIVTRMNHWDNYFHKYFQKYRKQLQRLFQKGNLVSIFTGDYTTTASIDLESKIMESGIFNCIIHEKKNFSHGRFINYEHFSNQVSIYLKQKHETEYEKTLITYLNEDQLIILESDFDGIIGEFDLLIATQYFMYYVSNLIDIDISKPTYHEEAMKLYYYKGDL